MGIVQRDLVMRLIEQLAGDLGRWWATAQRGAPQRPVEPLDGEQVARAAGLGLDLACALPPESVISVVGGARRLSLLGLAVGRLAWADQDPSLARQALALLAAAEPLEPAVAAARAPLESLLV